MAGSGDHTRNHAVDRMASRASLASDVYVLDHVTLCEKSRAPDQNATVMQHCALAKAARRLPKLTVPEY